MRSTRTTSGRSPHSATWVLALVTLLVVTTLALVACGGSGSSGDASSGGGSSGSGGAAGDSFIKAYPVAQEAVAAVAPDAVLLAAGTTGLALADVPDSWGFTYFSPAKNSVYMVDVEHGAAGEPRDLAAAKGVEVTPGTDVTTIKVGAADAVVKAREFARQSGEVPKNVMVGGTFAETPNSTEAGFVSGVWTVTFATGTDLEDAQAYSVDMMTGEVTKVKPK
jgi:hypothetical protein